MYDNIFQTLEDIIEETKGIGNVLTKEQKAQFLDYLNSEANDYVFNTLNEKVYLGHIIGEEQEQNLYERGFTPIPDKKRKFGDDIFDTREELKYFVLGEFDFFENEHLLKNPAYKAKKMLLSAEEKRIQEEIELEILKKKAGVLEFKDHVAKKKRNDREVNIDTSCENLEIVCTSALIDYAQGIGLNGMLDFKERKLKINGSFNNPFSKKSFFDTIEYFINENNKLSARCYVKYDPDTDNLQIFKRNFYFKLNTSLNPNLELLVRQLQREEGFIVKEFKNESTGNINYYVSGIDENMEIATRYAKLWGGAPHFNLLDSEGLRIESTEEYLENQYQNFCSNFS